MNRHALLVAVGRYAHAAFRDLSYARADAAALDQAWTPHVGPGPPILLTDAQATRRTVDEAADRLAAAVQPGDLLFIYLAGRGCSYGGRNLLALHDADPARLPASCVSIDELAQRLGARARRQAVWFLDISPLAAPAEVKLGAAIGAWDDERLRSLVDGPRAAVFSACRSGQASHRSRILKHGIWSHHLIEAFAGEAPLALRQGLLAADSLQAYLEAETPRTLRKTFASSREQTPWMHPAEADLPLIDAIDASAAGDGPQPAESFAAHDEPETSPAATRVALLSRVTRNLRSFPGWRKTHQVPDRANEAAARFVASLAAEELQRDLDNTYDALRDAFGFARRDMDSAGPDGGCGSILTPYFTYAISVTPSDADPSEAIYVRAVENITSPEPLAGAAFARVFDGRFDCVEATLAEPADLERLIDSIEAAKTPGVRLKYDRQLTYCEITLRGLSGTIRFTPRTLSIVHEQRQKTRQLLRSYELVRALLQQHQIPLLTLSQRRPR